MNDKYLVLASKSPRRKELLKSVGIKFKTADHKFDEDSADKNDPILYAEKVAEGKALSIGNLPKYCEKYILGVDTVVVHDGMILGKPKNSEEAEANIRNMSGKWHSVVSGVSIVNNSLNLNFTRSALSKVKFKDFSEEFINFYLDNNHWKGYAGGYAIQGIFALTVDMIEGSYTNIVGLPLETLYDMLKTIKYNIF